MGLVKVFLIIFSILLVIFSIGVISLTDKQIPANLLGGEELFSPSDWVKENQIKVYKNKITLDIEDASWATFTNTNSMDPFIDENSHAIEILPDDATQINVGDVISYQSSYGTIIHRVTERGEDKEGIYFLVKGDNNKFQDPFKVRFDDVKGVVVAVVY
ncbi:hypothetical protein HON71_02400 [Candidatus Woesearchaeota archaeon]|nr:hypothetical protein [Candidatus Woesearchaeota archaeon]